MKMFSRNRFIKPKSSQSNGTDSIENRSLPSTPGLHRPEINASKLFKKHPIRKHSMKPKNSTNKLSSVPEIFQYIVNSNFQNTPSNLSDYSDEEHYLTKNKNFNAQEKNSIQTLQHYKPKLNSDYEENKIFLPKLEPTEEDFLQKVMHNDQEAVVDLLHNDSDLNINCKDYQGRGALQIAIQNKSDSMVKLLLRNPKIDLGDAVLLAVKNNSPNTLETLLNIQNKISPGLEFAGSTHSLEFPEYLTPLMLAAHLGHFEIIKLLMSRGHSIQRPHASNCNCPICINAKNDPLYTSGSRLAAYRALSAPAYLVQVTSDPILAAFLLTSELTDNAAAFSFMSSAYYKLRRKVSDFAVELLSCCRTSEEVNIILNQSGVSGGFCQLPRLVMALDSKQKYFVAHPNAQQVLASYWRGGSDWWHSNFIKKAFIIQIRFIFIPLIWIMCCVAPSHSIVKYWQIPLNKLITHVSAYVLFLGLLFYISNQDKTLRTTGPHAEAEILLTLYVIGYVWSAIRMCVIQGPKRYFNEMWNFIEIIQLTLFIVTFFLWYLATLKPDGIYGRLERKYWSQYDPTLLAEGTFCVATILAYLRLLFLWQLNIHLGPLQVSLGKMVIDIYKYLIVFSIIISAFGAGLSRYYQYYEGMVYEDQFGMKTVQVSSFTSLANTLKTLFWALFCMSPLESADVVLENTRDANLNGTQAMRRQSRHAFTERVGYFCFGCFEVISVIVVLNMLIATMSNTFQKVTGNVQTEWTFAKTLMYMHYMSQTTLPSPFNMLPTSSGIYEVIMWLRTKTRSKMTKTNYNAFHFCHTEHGVDANAPQEFPAMMSVLVQRYFRKQLADTYSTIVQEETKLKNYM